MGANGIAAANTLRGFTGIRHGMCLYYVWQAYKAHGASADRSYGTALAGWFGSPGKHEGDRNPPAGVPVWFGAKPGNDAGDVVISLGDGRVVATDYPVYGVVGVCTIDERQRQIGRPYLGWTETILGAAIDYAGGGAPANLGGGQRTVGAGGARRRAEPSSQSTDLGDPLTPGTVGNFVGWIRGESVEGNDVWYKGTSGNWFWSGGFVEGANGTGIADLNPATPAPTPATPASNTRTVGAGGANGRTGPGRNYAAGQFLPAGTVGTFDGWTRGETVEGIDVWFRGALEGRWFWAGGFTTATTDGLPELATPAPTPTPTSPANADNPLGLDTYPPFYPEAVIGLRAPLGAYPRGTKGNPPVAAESVIDQFHIHRTGTDGDDVEWFSRLNDRSSCPHLQVLQDGRVREFIRPAMKPALTGPDWNWRGYGIEIQGAGDGTRAQFEAVAEIMAWLASYEGKTLDGIPVRYNLRTRANTTVTHREMVATECPGDWWQGNVDTLLTRARAILLERYNTDTPPPADGDDITVSRARLTELRDYLNGVLD